MTMETTLDTLVAARALIERPENWCQGVLAETALGIPIDPNDPRASRFCAVGALVSIAGQAYAPALRALNTFLNNSGLASFNNTQTHAEVITLFDRAIAAEKRKTSISVFTEILNTAGTSKQPANV